MKLLRFILILFVAGSFAGCSVNEKIEIKKNGAGNYSMDMDVSQMIDMMQQIMSKEDMAKKGMSKMDTTIYMKDILDSANGLPADKKALFKDGTVHLKMDIDAKAAVIHVNFPFSSQENLQKLFAGTTDGSLSMAELFKNLGGGSAAGSSLTQGMPNSDINQFNSIYDFTCHDGLISKRVNDARWKAFQNDPQTAQIKQFSSMGVSVTYTTTIVLPRPVKKIDNALVKLSDDKKTVTITFNLFDAIDHPEQYGYTIAY